MDVKLPPPLIVLSTQDLTALMPFGSYVDAVADAFRHARGRPSGVARHRCTSPPRAAASTSRPGSLPIGPGYTAIKVNGNFPNNRATHGLPTIQGAILLFDTVDRLAGRAARLDRNHHQAHRRRDRGRGALSGATRVAGRDDLRLRHARPRPARRAAPSARYPAGISSRQGRGCG